MVYSRKRSNYETHSVCVLSKQPVFSLSSQWNSPTNYLTKIINLVINVPALIAFSTDYITGGMRSRNKSIAKCGMWPTCVFNIANVSASVCVSEQVAIVDIITTQLFSQTCLASSCQGFSYAYDHRLYLLTVYVSTCIKAAIHNVISLKPQRMCCTTQHMRHWIYYDSIKQICQCRKKFYFYFH